MGNTADILRRELISVEPGTTVAKAAQVMKKANTGSVFVGKGPKPVGIFTERDISRRVVAEGLDPKKTKVEQVMTKKLITVDATEPLSQVFECLSRGSFRHLPITENGDVVGIVSLSDLARVLKEMHKDEKFLAAFAEGI